MKKTVYYLHVLEKGQRSTYSVTGPVLRIGSGDFCEIIINTEAAHAATIVLKDEELFFINRLPKHVQCGKQRINAGQRHPWVLGQVISIDQIAITLDAVSPKGMAESNTKLRKGPSSQPLPRTSSPTNQTTASEEMGKASSRKTLQLAIVVMCLLVISGMLLGGRGLVASRDRSQDLDSSFAEIHARLEQTQQAADIHRRMSKLQGLINSALAEPNEPGRRQASEMAVVVYCQQLNETQATRVTKAERTLAGRFASAFTLMRTRAAKAAGSLFHQCSSDLQGLLAANEKDAEVHSRLSALSDLLYRSQNLGKQTPNDLAARKRDAITFCRSLAEAKSGRISEAERRIAKNAMVLFEKGF